MPEKEKNGEGVQGFYEIHGSKGYMKYMEWGEISPPKWKILIWCQSIKYCQKGINAKA